MEIYLLRHGIAEAAQAGMQDADRALTSEGKKKLHTVLRVAKQAGVEPTLILTSPYRRAVETARIAAQELDYKGELIPTPELTPDSEPDKIWGEIRTHSDSAQLLLATHEPIMGELASYLLGAPGSMIEVRKGALIRIDIESFGPRPRGVLCWMLTPKLAGAASGK
jgi:phosphohistidine phosphatase